MSHDAEVWLHSSHMLLHCVCRYVAEPHGGSGARHAKARELLYGCQDGRIVQLLVDAGAVRQGFVLTPPGKEGMKAAVTAIHCGADYSKVCTCFCVWQEGA